LHMSLIIGREELPRGQISQRNAKRTRGGKALSLGRRLKIGLRGRKRPRNRRKTAAHLPVQAADVGRAGGKREDGKKKKMKL